MSKILEFELFGKMLRLKLYPCCYAWNRTLAILLLEEETEEHYADLTRCLDDAPGRNCAYIDVNNLGPSIVDCLEDQGFGVRTGRTFRSGYVEYLEFEFFEEVLREVSNKEYEQYLEWQDKLKPDEEYISACCQQCNKKFTFVVKKGSAIKYREYQEGSPYLIQNIFPNLSNAERGLFARGQNMCGKCYKKMFSF